MNPPTATVYGCPRCYYRLSPSTLPTLKRECPLCGSPDWQANPPERPKPDQPEKPTKPRK